jgi:NADH dehydrogenase [ubiquinone] 1 alpha subcomplex assembly factor 1
MSSGRYLTGILPIALVLMVGWTSNLSADDGRVLFDLRRPEAAKDWQTVNDGVMGGVSDGRFRISDQGIMEFYGTLSLENNGGFASVRSRSKKLGLADGEVIVARVRGDGRQYYLNLRVPTRQIAFSYRASFETKKGEWQEVKVPLKKFQATSFGRPIKDAAPVDPREVNSIGFLLADKKPGPFKLEVEWIKAVKRENRHERVGTVSVRSRKMLDRLCPFACVLSRGSGG